VVHVAPREPQRRTATSDMDHHHERLTMPTTTTLLAEFRLEGQAGVSHMAVVEVTPANTTIDTFFEVTVDGRTVFDGADHIAARYRTAPEAMASALERSGWLHAVGPLAGTTPTSIGV
jgi:hypothetical protein